MVLHLHSGEVRIDCPECDHLQVVRKPSGQVHCDRCKLLIVYDTGCGDNQFFRLRWQAVHWPLRYRKLGANHA